MDKKWQPIYISHVSQTRCVVRSSRTNEVIFDGPYKQFAEEYEICLGINKAGYFSLMALY